MISYVIFVRSGHSSLIGSSALTKQSTGIKGENSKDDFMLESKTLSENDVTMKSNEVGADFFFLG